MFKMANSTKRLSKVAYDDPRGFKQKICERKELSGKGDDYNEEFFVELGIVGAISMYFDNKHILIEQNEQEIFDKINKTKINLDMFPENLNSGYTVHFKKPIILHDSSKLHGVYFNIVKNTIKAMFDVEFYEDGKYSTRMNTVFHGIDVDFEFLIDIVKNDGTLDYNSHIFEGVDDPSKDYYGIIVKLALSIMALESLDQLSVLSGVWRNKISKEFTGGKYLRLNITSKDINASGTWHFRQLRAERYYHGEHAHKPRGSRWIFVAPELSKEEKAKHVPVTGFKNKEEAKRVVESVQAA